MTGHLKMLRSSCAMNNAAGAASRFPAQASKFICTHLTPTPPPSTSNPSANPHSRLLRGQRGDLADSDLVNLKCMRSG